MSENPVARSPVVILISAGQSPGPAVAAAMAAKGARVIAIDDVAERLDRLTLADPSRIEPLSVDGFKAETLQLLKDAWGHEPIDLVVNLMPMRKGSDISGQMRLLSMIVRTMIRGLVVGEGAIVSVVPRAEDNLALAAQGLWGAIKTCSAALGGELASNSVRVHALCLPRDEAERATGPLVFLGSPEGRDLDSMAMELR